MQGSFETACNAFLSFTRCLSGQVILDVDWYVASQFDSWFTADMNAIPLPQSPRYSLLALNRVLRELAVRL
jgi:hypothetical protein